MPTYQKKVVRELGTNVQSDFAKRLVDESTDKAYSLSELGLNNRTEEYFVPLTSLVQVAAWKDALPDSPDETTLGLGDAVDSVVTGTATDGSGGTASATETAAFIFVVPENYEAGEDLTIRVRHKNSAARTAESLVDVTAKVIGEDGAVGNDIVATDGIDTKAVTSYTDNDFTVTGTTVTPGAQLWVTISVENDDTGGSTAGTATVCAVSVLVPSLG